MQMVDTARFLPTSYRLSVVLNHELISIDPMYCEMMTANNSDKQCHSSTGNKYPACSRHVWPTRASSQNGTGGSILVAVKEAGA
jgi:hypothetical protein